MRPVAEASTLRYVERTERGLRLLISAIFGYIDEDSLVYRWHALAGSLLRDDDRVRRRPLVCTTYGPSARGLCEGAPERAADPGR